MESCRIILQSISNLYFLYFQIIQKLFDLKHISQKIVPEKFNSVDYIFLFKCDCKFLMIGFDIDVVIFRPDVFYVKWFFSNKLIRWSGNQKNKNFVKRWFGNIKIMTNEILPYILLKGYVQNTTGSWIFEICKRAIEPSSFTFN